MNLPSFISSTRMTPLQKKKIYSMGHFMEVKETSTNKDYIDKL